MRLIILFIAAISSINAFCQERLEQHFIKQVINERFIGQTPLSLNLTLNDTTDYRQNLLEIWNRQIDSEILIGLINNSKFADSTKWTDEELPKSFLISEQKKMPSIAYFYHKMSPLNTRDTNEVLNIVSQYKEVLTSGGIYYYSKPIFDSTGRYAVVAYDNGFGLSGRGGVCIYFYTDKKWQVLGNIRNWVH